MLKDKDIAACAAVAGELVDVWYLTDLPSERSASAAELSEILRALGVAAGLRLETFSDPVAAFAAARQAAREEDRIVAFGSFYLVGAILASLEARAKGHGR
jgi:dihydrofolate synthase/folylpolyglutamate synthase